MQMDNTSKRQLPFHDPQIEEPIYLSKQEKPTHTFIPLESKFPQFITSPCLSPLNTKFLGLHSPSPFQKCSFKLVDDLNLYQEEPSKQMHSSSFSSEISNIPNRNKSPQGRKFSQQVQTINRTPKQRSYPGRTAHGLRILSKKVYEIVLNQKNTSYKQVAEKLLFDFIANQTLQKADQREEKNIKRRVYDALNVLVAAEVIQKKGKEVLSWSLSFSPLESTPSKTIIEKNINLMKINQQITQKKKMIQDKKKLIEELHKKEQILATILRRNMKKKYKNKNKIKFPIIGALTKGLRSDEMQITNNGSSVVMGMQEIGDVYGDIDLLMRFDIVGHTTVDQMMEAQNFQDEIDEQRPIFKIKTFLNILQS